MGLGSAYRDGLALTSGEFVIIMDADLSHHPKYIPTMIECSSFDSGLKNGLELILSQAVATERTEELRAGAFSGSLPAERPISSPSLCYRSIAAILQAAFDCIKSKEDFIQRGSRAIDPGNQNKRLFLSDGDLGEGQKTWIEDRGNTHCVRRPTVRQVQIGLKRNLSLFEGSWRTLL